jgi:uncharacterized OB-fold protein
LARKLPALTQDTEAFWQGGAQGRLMMHRCRTRQTWFHPPTPICPCCGSLDVGPEPVSGRGTVRSFTVNYNAWTPGLEEPYVVAIVELEEQPGLQFLTNIVHCPPEQVAIDMPVQVTFLQQDDIWLPLFEPEAAR